MNDLEQRIRQAWQGRVSGCMLGKAVETFSMREGHDALQSYLSKVDALPLRDYIPYNADHAPELVLQDCCKDHLTSALPDDDINYSVLALMLLERHGADLTTEDVARAWLKYLPLASTFTAERAAYCTIASRGKEWFAEGAQLGFDIAECADNPFNEWIGAQIRADVYGWVAPGNPKLAAHLATVDAALSHQHDGIYGAVAVAVMGAILAGGGNMDDAIQQTFDFIPPQSGAADAIRRGLDLAGDSSGGERIRAHYQDLSPVHTLNNLALVIWALASYPDDFDAAIGDVVAAGLDTDCNGATVGALWGLQGKPLPEHWLDPWQGNIQTSLAGVPDLQTEQLTQRTVVLAQQLSNPQS